jgi:hypothetical protein
MCPWHFSSGFHNPLGEKSYRRRMTAANSLSKKRKTEQCSNKNVLHFSEEQWSMADNIKHLRCFVFCMWTEFAKKLWRQKVLGGALCYLFQELPYSACGLKCSWAEDNSNIHFGIFSINMSKENVFSHFLILGFIFRTSIL